MVPPYLNRFKKSKKREIFKFLAKPKIQQTLKFKNLTDEKIYIYMQCIKKCFSCS